MSLTGQEWSYKVQKQEGEIRTLQKDVQKLQRDAFEDEYISGYGTASEVVLCLITFTLGLVVGFLAGWWL